MKDLYPVISPRKEGTLAVTPPHQLYYAEYGNPNGIPVVYCHGGPGAGTDHDEAQFYDPTKYRIILWHQRGSGKSTPLGELSNNNTQALISDLELLRQELHIDQWVVAGGSWGSTLALLYAQDYPERVLGLILRGIFLTRDQDIYAFWRDDCLGAKEYPEAWEKFKRETAKLMKEAGIEEGISSRPKDYHAYYNALIHHQDETIQSRAAQEYSEWETHISFLVFDPKRLEWTNTPDGVNMGRMEAYYLTNHAFIPENKILDNVQKIAHIPVYIAQGARDLVCPPYQAQALVDGLRQAGNTRVDLKMVHSGHSMFEPATMDALVNASDDFALQYTTSAAVSSSRQFIEGQSSGGTQPAVIANVVKNKFEK